MGAGASSGSNVATSRSEHGGELNEEAPKTSQQAIEEIEQLKRQVKSLEAKISRLTIAQLEAQGRRTEGPVRELTMAKSEAEASVLSSGNEWFQQRIDTRPSESVGWRGLPTQTRQIIDELPALPFNAKVSKAGADADWPIVVTLDQLKVWDAAHGDCACAIYRIAKLRIGESIRELAAMALQVLEADDDDPLILQSSTAKLFTFPSDPSSLAWASTKQNEAFNTKTLIEAREVSSSVWKRFSFKKEFISLVRSCSEGRVDEGIAVRNCVYNETAMSTFMNATLWPCVLLEEDGGFSWCFIRHGQPLGVSSPIVWAWSLRDLLMVRNTPAPIVLVDPKSGTLVWQNSASMELIGVHGVDNIQTRPSCKDPIETTRLDYLSLLFHNEDDLKDTMIKLVGQGKPWNSRMMVQSPVLKSLIRVSRRTALWYDVSISQVRDPVDLAPLLTILMIDVTSIVEAERRVKLSMESQHALLKQILPQQVTDILLQRVQNKGQAQMTSEMIHDRFSIKSESMVGTGSGDYFGEGVLSSGPSLGGGGSVLSSAPSFNNALTRQQVMDLSTKHDEVSILFADIVGFTNLSSKVDPSAVMLMLSDLFGRFDAYLDEFDVWKVGTIGDCYFCITGLFDRSGPDNEKRLAAITDLDGSFWSADEDDIGQGTLGGRDPQHAEKMLGFAKSMMDLLRDVPSPLGGNIQMRVGIHTGSIWSGVVGRKMPRFDVFGDAVNTASRMESHGIPGKIHVSEEFAKQLPDEKWLERNIQVKGKGEMKTYLLEDEGYDAAPPPEGSRTLMRMQSSILQQVKMEVKQGFFSSWWNKPKTQAKASKKKPSDGVQTVSFDKP